MRSCVHNNSLIYAGYSEYIFKETYSSILNKGPITSLQNYMCIDMGWFPACRYGRDAAV